MCQVCAIDYAYATYADELDATAAELSRERLAQVLRRELRELRLPVLQLVQPGEHLERRRTCAANAPVHSRDLESASVAVTLEEKAALSTRTEQAEDFEQLVDLCVALQERQAREHLNQLAQNNA